MNQFNVLNWDINRNELESYDVLPYFRKCYEECRKKDKPKTVDEWKEFIRQKGIYICSGQDVNMKSLSHLGLLKRKTLV